MLNNTDNVYIKFYGERNISPVAQDINDFSLHLDRRKKLYRQLGIPAITFKNRKILEVGAGSGYNTLTYFEWEGDKVDIVEPNAKGREEMKQLFDKQNISSDRYSIYENTIEDYFPTTGYDIIIAEGFLPSVINKLDILDKLVNLLNKQGVLVITCMDEIGMFVEQMKRLIGHILSRDIKNYDDKLKILENVFSPQLKELKGVSRSPKDWIQDQLINPAVTIRPMLSMADAMEYLKDKCDILGSSPNMFTDYSWYKDTEYDYIQSYLEQFRDKRHNLLEAGTEEIIIDANNSVIFNLISEIEDLAIRYETHPNKQYIESIILLLQKLAKQVEKVNVDIYGFTADMQDILNVFKNDEKLISKCDFSNYHYFFKLFGRSQQYISFVTK